MLKHYEINIPIDNSLSNFERTKTYCSKNKQQRIYKNWQAITEFNHLLQMLGFTLKYRYDEAHGKMDIILKHWYGYSEDIPEVKKLIDVLDKAKE